MVIGTCVPALVSDNKVGAQPSCETSEKQWIKSQESDNSLVMRKLREVLAEERENTHPRQNCGTQQQPTDEQILAR